MASKKDKQDENFDDWKTIIIEEPLDDENWKVKVIVIETTGAEHEIIYLHNFETFATEEKRFVIKNISKTETIYMINQYGDKKTKDPNLRVFEECYPYLANKRDIPPDLLALVIKQLLLKMKEEDIFISQQKQEVIQVTRKASNAKPDKTGVKATGESTRKESYMPLSAVKSKIKDADMPSGVLERLHRVCNEEYTDVDDYPTDGPNLYVAVTGFLDPYLPGNLVKAGVPLTAVVQIKMDKIQTEAISIILPPTKKGHSLTECVAEKSLKFWDDIQLLRIQGNDANNLENTAFIVFSPPYLDSDDQSKTPEIIYDEVSFLMYDIQDLSRQHLHYKENMNVIEVPKDVSKQYFNMLYEQKFDDLPLECVNIYAVLDSILQTVCTSSLDDSETSGTSLLSAATLVTERKNKIEEKKEEKSENVHFINTLCNTEAGKKKYRLTYGQEYDEIKEPVVLQYGDLAKYNTFQLRNINLDNVVFSSLLGMPINYLWQNQPQPSDEHEAKINFHVNVLLSCFERNDVETAELNRLLNILACRKLYNNRSSLKKRHLPSSNVFEFKKKYLKRNLLAEPLYKCPPLGIIASSTFPSMIKSENESALSQKETEPDVQRLKLLFECPDISELVTAAEIENNQPTKHNMIDDFNFFEDLSENCAHQILREAYNKFNCIDYKYCEVTDCFILMFFNSHDNDGIAREEWRSHLTTPLGLQDFFDVILDEKYEWIQNEERIYDENLLMEARKLSKDTSNLRLLKSYIPTTEVEMDHIDDSLKCEEYIQVEDGVTETSELTKSLTTKVPLSFDTHLKKNGSERKSSKYIKQSFVREKEYESVEVPAKPFLGYNLGAKRIEVYGKDAIFFSRDGTKVTSTYTLTTPINLEYITLNIVPGNSNNEFWVHKTLGDHVTQEIKDACESFRITSKNQVLIYIRKQIYKTQLNSLSATTIDNAATTRNKINPSKEQLEDKQFITEETKYFHSLYVSWPNGLITEPVYENNSPVISHIKQYHTCGMQHLDEEMRCISLNGDVIIFKSSDHIEVLKPDGTFIKITKCYKSLVLLSAPEPEVVVPPVEVDKKPKKSKVDKSSPKILEPVEEIITDLPPPEYELKIDEFEVIEPNGLRQKWVDDVPFNLEKLPTKTATDFNQGEVFSRRMDGTNILMNEDGLHCVTFPDKTKIITSYVVDDIEVYPEWTEEEIQYFECLETFESDTVVVPKSNNAVSQASNISTGSLLSKNIEEEEVVEKKEKTRTDGYIFIHILYSIEHPNFSTISINNIKGTISVESPNETVVTVDKDNNYEIKLDSETSATFNGETLFISYEACSECRAFTNCNITIMNNEERSLNNSNDEQMWLKMTDSFNTQVVVTEDGAISLSDEPAALDALQRENGNNIDYGNKNTSDAEEKDPDAKSESSLVSHGKCREMYLAKNIRFFILRRDLTCAELVHRAIVDEYKRACRWKPWCSINQYDTFGDHRDLISILTPVHLTETEKWLMKSKHASKPKFMTYKDLKEDTGKGFYHWMRAQEKIVPQHLKPDNILPEKLPRAYILRTLERQWDEEKRKDLKGARELTEAVLRYRTVMAADCETVLNTPIIDSRTEDERRVDDAVQALAHRIYEDLRAPKGVDVKPISKPSSTKFSVHSEEEISIEGENFAEEVDMAKCLEEERERWLKEAEAAEEISPALKRYWRHRDEEQQAEQFYTYLQRGDCIPQYFRDALDGAKWWDVDDGTDEAVALAESRKMNCVCVDDEASILTESTTEKFEGTP